MREVIQMILLSGLLLSNSSFAVDIAQCSNPKGKSYYPYLGMMDKKDAGWTDDGITGGITTLTKTSDGQYDILFVDAFKTIVSTIGDGGKVMVLSRGQRDVSFLVIYPRKTAEIYTFLVDKAGKSEFTVVTSRGGDEVMFPKTSLFRGDCQFVNIDLVK